MVSFPVRYRRILLPGLFCLSVAAHGPLHAAPLDEVLSGQGARSPSNASSGSALSLDTVFDGADAMSDKDKGDLLMKTGYEYLKGENSRPKDSSQARQQFIKALKYTSKAAVSLSVNFNENEHLEKLAQADDTVAMDHLVTCYTYGNYGYSRNFAQAEYWARRRYEVQPEGGEALMQKVQKEQQYIRQVRAQAEADRRRDEEYRLAQQEREWKTEQKRLDKEMEEAEEKMQRDQEQARQQAEADAAAERSAAGWRDTINHIQNTGNEIVSDLRRTQRQTNQAIHIAQHQQEEINRKKRNEFERKKRELEEKQARRRSEYEAEQKRIADQQQEAHRRAEQDRQRFEAQTRASQTPSPPDHKAPASTLNQTEQLSSPQTPPEKKSQYADLSFSVAEKAQKAPTPREECERDPDPRVSWNAQLNKCMIQQYGDTNIDFQDRGVAFVGGGNSGGGRSAATGVGANNATVGQAGQQATPNGSTASALNASTQNPGSAQPAAATFRRKSVVTGEPLYDAPQAGPWGLLFHLSNTSLREPYWPISGFKGITAAAVCTDEASGAGGNPEVVFHMRNSTGVLVFIFAEFKIENTHEQVGYTVISRYIPASGAVERVGSTLAKNVKCEMDNMQVFVRAKKVQYDKDKGMYVGPQ